MKIKFISALHRKTFTEFITANVKNPYLSRNEYIAAVFYCPQISFCGNGRGAHLPDIPSTSKALISRE